MKCHFCHEQAIGINYRPNPDLTNKPTCEFHKTNLYIPFAEYSHHDITNRIDDTEKDS